MKDEFYRASEYHRAEEFKHFPAEMYRISRENSTAPEIAPSGREITTLQHKEVGKRKRSLKKMSDNLLQSFKGVATATTVAAAAVVGTLAISTTPPAVSFEISEVGDSYICYTLTAENLQENEDYFVIISAPGQEDVTVEVTENGSHHQRVEGLKPAWEYTLAFVREDPYIGQVVHFEKVFQTKSPSQTPAMPQGPPVLPEVSVSEVNICGVNEIEIGFTATALTDAHTLALQISYQEGEEKTVIPLTKNDVEKGYVTVALDRADILQITPLLTQPDGTPVACPSFAPQFEKNLDADVLVRLKEHTILFYLRALVSGTVYAHVINTDTEELLYQDLLYGHTVAPNFTLPTSSSESYTLFLTNERGEKVSNDYTVTVDTSLSTEYAFDFYGRNPLDIPLTYNENGTVNVYIPTQFSTEEESLYCQVMLDDRRFTSREKLFEITDLPNRSYAICYDICFAQDGVQYSVYHLYPSGAINEAQPGNYLNVTLSDTQLVLTVSEDNKSFLLLNTLTVHTSLGEVYAIKESDFVYREAEFCYELVLPLTVGVTQAEISVECAPYLGLMEGITEYKGSTHILYTETYYN